MDSKIWTIKSHIIPASHVRGYARGVRDEKAGGLKLSVNQYTPKVPPAELPSPVSIIFIHGVGSTKESYEPFFARLLDAGVPIRSIWAADIAWHGHSYILNADTIGDSPHWDDTARDMLHLANTFQAEMPPPIVAMGQSWGGYPVLQAALLHPRLFAGVVALEPWVGNGASLRHSFPADAATNMARRRDRWASRAEAARTLRATPYFAAFDVDVFARVVRHDLRSDGPAAGAGGPVTLVTPKAMEVATMMRAVPSPGDPEGSEFAGEDEQRVLPGFYRAEPVRMLAAVRNLRPPALFVFGTESPVGRSILCPFLLQTVGTGELGSGGREKGLVADAWVPGAGHPMPLEKPKETADAIAPWIVQQMKRWEEQSAYSKKQGEFWVEKLNPEWVKAVSKL